MADNLLQLDQSGTNAQFVKTWMGPTLGWMMLPVVPELEETTAGPLSIGPYTSRVLLKAAITPIALPQCALWMLAQPPLGNLAAFDRSLWIKDYAYAATPSAPIVINAFSGDIIDGQTSFSIVEAGDLIRLYPLTDLTGWYVG